MRKTVKFILVSLILSIAFNLNSQTKDDAGAAYNEGVQFVKTDNFNQAIASFEKAIQLCEKVGAEANEIKKMASQQLPAQYYKSATALYEQKKVDEAIKRFEKTASVADKYNDPEIKEKANKMIPKLYYLKGATYYKKEDFENAIKNLDIAIKYDPDFEKAYYVKGNAHAKLGDPAKMKESFDIAISKAQASGNTKTLSRTKKAGMKYLTNFAIKAIQKEQYDEAIKYLDQTSEYGQADANIYYYYALSYNKKKEWEKAISAATKGIELEKDDNTAKAKHYFELGTAYQGKGDAAEACSAFKKAAYGDYTAQANYQIKEVLKCN